MFVLSADYTGDNKIQQKDDSIVAYDSLTSKFFS